MTINAYCSPPANRLKEYQHEGCPGTVYKYDFSTSKDDKSLSAGWVKITNRTLVLCSCTCHSKKEAR